MLSVELLPPSRQLQCFWRWDTRKCPLESANSILVDSVTLLISFPRIGDRLHLRNDLDRFWSRRETIFNLLFSRSPKLCCIPLTRNIQIRFRMSASMKLEIPSLCLSLCMRKRKSITSALLVWGICRILQPPLGIPEMPFRIGLF